MSAPATTTATAAPGSARPNPYVGPRAFKYNEQLWGRDREIAELVDLLIAERIVLLSSPSGAGKTSLIEAGLRKALERERFRVLPSIRVAAPTTGAGPLPADANPYVTSALLCIEKALPGDASLFDSQTPVDLAAALDRLVEAEAEADPSAPASAPASAPPTVLIFDQFEEVLTLNPADQRRKEEFFAQVGRALRDRDRWALFAMREEYVAALDPYLRPIPTRLATRYRLDLLGPAAALEAIQQPARQQQVDFTDAAARLVIDDLRRIKVPRPGGGGSEEALGPHVEPVQLQVVCRRIWNALPAGASIVHPDGVTPAHGTPAATAASAAGGQPPSARALVGDAQRALTAYYDETLQAIVSTHKVNERRLRDWFERELLTTQDLRTQVAQDAEETAAIRDAVPALLAAHLIREETRRGGTWYELAHDRLVGPVRQSNKQWYREHASGVERQAAVWHESGRRPDLLFGEAEIDSAEQWGREHADLMTERVQAFLNASRRAVLERATTRTRTLAAIAGAVAVILALAAGLSLFALSKARALQQTQAELAQAEIQRVRAEAAKQQADADLQRTAEYAGELVQRQYGETPAAVPATTNPPTSIPTGPPPSDRPPTTLPTATDPGPKPAMNDPPTTAYPPPPPPPPAAQQPGDIRPPTVTSPSSGSSPSGGEGETKARAVDPKQSLRADLALRRLRSNNANVDAPSAAATIMYYTRDRDDSRVVDELEKLGFAFSLQPSRRSSRTSNCVWYGPEVTLEDVKLVALALLRAGVALQAIKPFETVGDKASIIEIGNRNMPNADVLTVDDVQELSREMPEVYARPPRPRAQ